MCCGCGKRDVSLVMLSKWLVLGKVSPRLLVCCLFPTFLIYLDDINVAELVFV